VGGVAISVERSGPANVGIYIIMKHLNLKRIALLLAVTALLVTGGLGCNTVHGFGKDVQKTGESIQDSSK